MIDPRRKRQNEELEALLRAFVPQLEDEMWEGDPRRWDLVDTIHRKSKRTRPRSPGTQETMDYIASPAAFEAADELRATSVEPLRKAIKHRPVVFTVDGEEFTAR